MFTHCGLLGNFSSTNVVQQAGDLWAWGQYPDSLNIPNSISPVQLQTNTKWRMISSAGYTKAGITQAGNLRLSYLGGDLYNDYAGAGTNWTWVSCGFDHSLGIKNDRVYGWGTNTYNQIGNGQGFAYPITNIPMMLCTAGTYNSFGITPASHQYGWGRNYNGDLGMSNQIQQPSPVDVSGGRSWAAVYATNDQLTHRVMGLTSIGEVYGWGNISYLGGATMSTSPVSIFGGYTAISGGVQTYGVSIVKNDNTIWSIGNGFRGLFGNGTLSTTPSTTPVQSIGGGWKSLSMGFGHTVALKLDNSLWTWGWNNHGQLGDGTLTDSGTPINILPGSTWLSATAGAYNTMAIRLT